MPPTSAPQYQGPSIDPSVPFEIRLHLTQIYQKLGNHNQGFGLLNDKIKAITAGTTTVVQTFSGGGGSSGGGSTGTIGLVDNQSGQTSYTTQPGDYGSLLVLSDASPIAVTLAAGGIPYFLIIANVGAGTATLTPATPPSGTSTITYPANPGASSMPLLGGQFTIVAYDGTNFFAALDVLAQTFNAVAHEWIDSYDATTGLFTASRPDYSDLTGTPTLPATIAPVAGEYLTGYDSSTGLFSQSTPAGVGGTITLAALTGGGTQGSITVTNGLITAFVNPT